MSESRRKPFGASRPVKPAPKRAPMRTANDVKIDLILSGKKHYDESTAKRIRGGKSGGGGRKLIKKLSGSGTKDGLGGRGSRARSFGRGVNAALRHGKKTQNYMQRAVVQVSYTAMRGGNKSGAWKAHARYLIREGVEHEDAEKGGGIAFDGSTDDVDLVKRVGAWAEAGDERMFKMVLSPERGDAVDLKKVTRAFMAEMEQELGTRLQWAAVDHYNTDNPHVHVVIRGLDDQGKPLQISPLWIKERPRAILSNIMTKELGYRTEHDIRKAAEQSVTRMLVTPLDRKIRDRMDHSDDGVTVRYTGRPEKEWEREQQALEIRRLRFLETIGAAQYIQGNTWKVSDNFEKVLKHNQILHDRTRSLHHMKELLTEPNAPLAYRPRLEVGEWIMGRVIGGGFDERSDRPFFAVEGIDHKLHMLDASPALEKMRADGRIKNGDLIALKRVEKEIVKKDKDGQDKSEKIQTYSLYRWGLVDRKSVPDSAVFLAQSWSLEQGKGLERPTTGPEGFARTFQGVADRLVRDDLSLSGDAVAMFRAFESARMHEVSLHDAPPMRWVRDPEKKREGSQDLIGRVLWKGETQVLVQGIDNEHFSVPVSEFGKFAPRVGSDVWIRAHDPIFKVSKFDKTIAEYIETHGKGSFDEDGFYRFMKNRTDYFRQQDKDKTDKETEKPQLDAEQLTRMAVKRVGTWERVGVEAKGDKADILDRLDKGFAAENAKVKDTLPWGKITEKHLEKDSYRKRLALANRQKAVANLKVARVIAKVREDREAQRAQRQARKQQELDLGKDMGR